MKRCILQRFTRWYFLLGFKSKTNYTSSQRSCCRSSSVAIRTLIISVGCYLKGNRQWTNWTCNAVCRWNGIYVVGIQFLDIWLDNFLEKNIRLCYSIKNTSKIFHQGSQSMLTILGSSESPLEYVTAIVEAHFSPYHVNFPREDALPIFKI